MPHHIIYIAGFSDKQPYGQAAILKFWQIFGVKTHYHRVGWTDQVAFKVKLEEILAKVDLLSSDGSPLSIIGTSAAGCTAILAYSKRKDRVSGVATICAKLLNPKPVNPKYFKENPPFKESIFSAQPVIKALTAQERQKILCLYPLRDQTVRTQDMCLPGSPTKRIFAFGHIPAIYTALIFNQLAMIRFLKSRAQTTP